MSLPQLAAVELVPGPVDRPLLVLGPSLGTLVSTLWGAAAQRLGQQFESLAGFSGARKQRAGWQLHGG
jgi:predicted alpha/beta hydrolase